MTRHNPFRVQRTQPDTLVHKGKTYLLLNGEHIDTIYFTNTYNRRKEEILLLDGPGPSCSCHERGLKLSSCATLTLDQKDIIFDFCLIFINWVPFLFICLLTWVGLLFLSILVLYIALDLVRHIRSETTVELDGSARGNKCPEVEHKVNKERPCKIQKRETPWVENHKRNESLEKVSRSVTGRTESRIKFIVGESLWNGLKVIYVPPKGLVYFHNLFTRGIFTFVPRDEPKSLFTFIAGVCISTVRTLIGHLDLRPRDSDLHDDRSVSDVSLENSNWWHVDVKQ